MTPTAILVSLREFGLVNSRLPLMRALVEDGWRVVAATVPHGDTKLSKAGVEVVPIPFRRGAFSACDAGSVRALRRLYRDVGPHLVHHFNAKPVVYGNLAAGGLDGTRVVNTVTGLGHGFDHRRLSRLGSSMAYRLTTRRADAVIFQNADDRETFVERGWVARHRTRLIVSSGVNLAHFPQPVREANANTEVLMAGRLLWGKGVGEFVEAAQVLRQRGHEGEIALGGEWECGHPDGVDRDFIEEAEREGAIKFLGYIEDMPQALADCAVFVAPSYYREGVARVLLEAAASRRPVIAADASGARSVIRHGETGLLVPPRDATALAEAIATLVSNPDKRRAMGDAAYRYAAAHFSLDAVTEQQLQVYRDIGAVAPDRLSSRPSGDTER